MGNDYTELEKLVSSPPQPGSQRVSIVIPTYNRADKLGKLLAALTHQSFPLENMEVIVTDDGSSDTTHCIVREYSRFFDIKHIWQRDSGHRLSAVCNLGIRAASHDHIVLLQSDMLPSTGLIEAYLQWLSIARRILLIGGRVFVEASGISENDLLQSSDFEKSLPHVRTKNKMWDAFPMHQEEDWREALYRTTSRLKQEKWPFRAVVGSNLAFHKHIMEDIGGFDEEFQSWGGEDGEFGYRAFNAGYYLIPVKDAVAYHQEPPDGENETDRITGFEISKAIRSRKCALPPFRMSSEDRSDWKDLIAHAMLVSACSTVNTEYAPPRLPFSVAEINSFIKTHSEPYILLSILPVDPHTIFLVVEQLIVNGTSTFVHHSDTDLAQMTFLAFSRRAWAIMEGFHDEANSLESLSEQIKQLNTSRQFVTALEKSCPTR
ncbi:MULTISPECIES: glycosyltransferase [Citrobacter]|uniref:glycosyltransferase n=1 Tax=Citrobacter TaxID=544 RepID=UPI0010C9653A|nr:MULTISPECIES: glycosyltransferase [Citrobacter]MDL4458311.1 glycosyltransferase [Citrobacter youngae]TKU92830.1 glycosyltransferase [Citrobacter sp. wls617]HEF0078819.1 glycosyltransferase [Citrobacter youngae]